MRVPPPGSPNFKVGAWKATGKSVWGAKNVPVVQICKKGTVHMNSSHKAKAPKIFDFWTEKEKKNYLKMLHQDLAGSFLLS